jgi:hypothetical protein
VRGIHVQALLIDRRGNMRFAGDPGVSRLQLDMPIAQRQDLAAARG